MLDGSEVHFPGCFDVVFCLGVLYHCTDPMKMLRTLWQSMAPKATLYIDCQGIPDTWPEGPESVEGGAGEGMGAAGRVEGSCSQPLCLVPRRAYANAGGIWFLPNQRALRVWLERANFINIEV